ncbi:MAG: hypothetical protein WBA00_20845 [Rhodococcus sp. (in: high G+C Gram-positive bacteria)]
MSDHSRRNELIAGALADDLDEGETAELRALAVRDPSVDDEIRALRDTVDMLSPAAGLNWTDPEPSELLRRRIARIERPAPPRWTTVAAAAAGIAIGVGAVLGVQSVGAGSDPAVIAQETVGPPGELGSFETVDFTESAPGVSVDGGLVAHTWGTETVLEITGVPVNEAFEVVLLGRSGETLPSSGTFLGSVVPIDCRMNAAVLRPEVVGIEIRAAAGRVMASASVPTVS